MSYLISIIRPTTEFHVTMLIIKWEPSDVYLACAFKDAWGHVQTTAVMFDHYIGLIRPIESLIRTKFFRKKYRIFTNLLVDYWLKS